MLPVGVEELVLDGHEVLIEAGAGLGSGLTDEEYSASGATIVATADKVWSESDLIVKVKEPQVSEYARLRAGQILFTYFHFAASRSLTDAVLNSRSTASAYETIRDAKGSLPLLTPMSEVAGRMSIQKGANFLERPEEGRGILLSGVPGVAPAEVVVLGGGIVGANAARVAAGLDIRGSHCTHGGMVSGIGSRRGGRSLINPWTDHRLLPSGPVQGSESTKS